MPILDHSVIDWSPGKEEAMLRRLTPLIGTVGLLTATLMLFLVWNHRPGVLSEWNYLRVQPGMAEAEVDSLLGGSCVRSAMQLDGSCDKLWRTDEAVAVVRFARGRVTAADLYAEQ